MATRFGAYEILYELKAGGMGAVLLGRRRGPGSFEQLVAIKTIRSEYASTEAVRAMFLDEAAILARLNHPGVATVHDFGEDAGTLYMVMEYVAGLALRDLDRRPPPIVVARAIAEACRGLHAAHELRDLSGSLLGLVHRDISPDNLMVGYDGHVKVIDFGIALIRGRQAPVTEFGTVKGKPPYMSPEQVKNASLDRRSDVFSLAVVAWELLVGRGLFEGDSIYAIARAVEHQQLVPPSEALGVQLPAGLDAVVMSALERDLDKRTPSAAALAEQLEEVIGAAGGETLEAWAERELADKREAHRQWLSRVVGGRTTGRLPGRPTGAVTAISPIAPTPIASPALVEPPPPPPRKPEPEPTMIVPPRRRSVAIIVIALLVVLTAVGIVWITRDRTPSSLPTRDAAIASIDAHVVIDAPRIDAPVLEPVHDAASTPAVDAAIHHPVMHDARTPPHDSPRVVDASAAVEPAGDGFLRISHPSDTYLNVLVDGELLGPTPMIKPRRISAGRHTVKLVHPASNDVVLTRTIVVRVGETATIE